MTATILSAGHLNDLIDARNTLSLVLATLYNTADAARTRNAADLEQHLYQTAGLINKARSRTEQAILLGAAAPSSGATADVGDGHQSPQKSGVVR